MRRFKTLAKIAFYLVAIVFISEYGYSQNVGISEADFTPDNSSILELKSTTKGFLMPRMTRAERLAIAAPAHGLMVIQTDDVAGDSPGIWYYNDPDATWYLLLTGSVLNSSWQLTGNTATDPALNFVGTFDTQDLVLRTDNTERIRVLSTGEVGIGTTTPTQPLDVEGNIIVTNTNATPAKIMYQESSAEGSNYTSFQAPEELDDDLPYTLPEEQGDTNSILMNDGGGILTWSNSPFFNKVSLHRPTTILVTTDNQYIPVETSFIMLDSDDKPNSRNIVLGDGEESGHLVLFTVTSAAAGDGVKVNRTLPNVMIHNDMTLTYGDTFFLVWNGAKWLEISYFNY